MPTSRWEVKLHFFQIQTQVSLSAWTKKKGEYKYELQDLTDVIRFTKQNKKKGISVQSITRSPHELKVAFINSDGSLWIWEWRNNSKFQIMNEIENLSSPISCLCVNPYPEQQSIVAIGTQHGTLQVFQKIKNL